MATATHAAGPVEVIRKNQVQQVVVRADSAGVDLARAQVVAQGELTRVTWPTGYDWSIGGKGAPWGSTGSPPSAAPPASSMPAPSIALRCAPCVNLCETDQ